MYINCISGFFFGRMEMKLKKIFEILVPAILVNYAVISAQPVDSDADGYFEIVDFSDLQWLSNTPGAWDRSYELSGDIDASDSYMLDVGDHDGDPSTPNVARGWTPIGRDLNGDGDCDDSGEFFSGKIEGRGFAIDSLFINRPKDSFIGLFGAIATSDSGDVVIDSLFITNIDYTGDDYIGGLAGYAESSTANIIITNSSVTGVESGATRIGGLIGFLYAGSSGISISKSYTEADITGTYRLGGICGYMLTNTGFIAVNNSYAIGDVSGTSRLGGLAGYVYGSGISLSNCYSVGAISGTVSPIGAIAGEDYSGAASWSGCVWNTATSTRSKGIGNLATDPPGVVSASDSAMKNQSTYTNTLNWDFDNTWAILEQSNSGYPFLQTMSDLQIMGDFSIEVKVFLYGYLEAGGHAPAPILIEIYKDVTTDTTMPAISFVERHVAMINSEGIANTGIIPDSSTLDGSKSYFIMVKVPGYLPVLSSSAVAVSNDKFSWDFSSGYNKAVGEEKALYQSGNIFMMKPGNFDRDMMINADDAQLMVPGYGSNLYPYLPFITE
jgi:hypothetical protein